MKKILIIDGQGGGIGKLLVEKLKGKATVVAAGTNALATSAMLKAGADAAVTGENAIVFNCRDCDVIAGPMGIVMANALMGEITPNMAEAVSSSKAKKILIPSLKCRTVVVGCNEKGLSEWIAEAVRLAEKELGLAEA